MKAYYLRDVGKFNIEDIPEPQLRDGEVIVDVKAAGICGSDIPRIYETGAHVHPIVIGHEFSGIVSNVGKNVDGGWMGKRVGIFPLIPCKTCEQCRKEQYEMCRNYSYLGSRTDGGFAEKVAVPEWNLIKLPENVSFEEAAMLEPMAVAVHAMRRIAPTEKDSVMVVGMGTIGLLLVMFLKEQGVKNIYVVYNKDSQKKYISDMGILDIDCCDSRKQDVEKWIKNKTNEQGVDIFFECVGKNETAALAINCVASAGKVMLVGNPHSNMMFDKATYWKVLRNQLAVYGTWNSSFTHKEDDDWHYVLGRVNERKIQPKELISHRFGFDDILQGFEIMRDKKEDYVKIMLSNLTSSDKLE